MNTLLSLEEKIKRAKATPFSMPKDIGVEQKTLPTGNIAYVFRHTILGELGRLLILPHPSGKSQFNVEVSGDPNDPMTKKRRALLEPVTQELIGKMDAICGKDSGETTLPYNSPKEQHRIASEVMPCNHCGAPTAMLILVPEATTQDVLEDVVRLMYEPVQKMAVPTWALGQENEIKMNGELEGDALVMKVHPIREKATRMRSSQLNAELDQLMENHCE